MLVSRTGRSALIATLVFAGPRIGEATALTWADIDLANGCKLRHTFASTLYVRGEDPPYVMGQLGHSDAGFTLRVYAHAMRRDEGARERRESGRGGP